jgi:hypothetical protein
MDAKLNLKKKERDYLRAFKKSGNHSLREFNHASVLLFLDKGLTIFGSAEFIGTGPDDCLAN